MNKRVIFILALVLLAAIPVTIDIAQQQQQFQPKAQTANTNIFVSPGGSDTNDGTNAATPLKTIQAALNKATPGTTINLAAGTYKEKLTTMTNGTVAAPITIKGPETGKDKAGRYKAILYGPEAGRILNVDHSYYVFEGFTIDGQEKLATTTYPTSLNEIRAFKDSVQSNVVDTKLIYVGSADTSRDITGVVIRNMFLSSAGTECVRLRNNAKNNIVENSVIQWCGMIGNGDDSSQYKYHNAEGVYIGTSPKSTTQPMYANDGSSFNIVRNNTIHTFGSECFQVKENAHDNLFENNDCRFNDEPHEFLGSLIELRGYNNKIIGNTLQESRGVGIKMKSDADSDPQGGNSGQNNTFSAIANAAIMNEQNKSQGVFCGNTISGTVSAGTSVGNPTAPCANPTIGSTITPSAAPSPTIVPPTLITPTIYCVGGAGVPPCAPIDASPTTATTVPMTGAPSTTVSPAVSASPTSGSSVPSPTTDPCSEQQNSIFHDKGKKKKKFKKDRGGGGNDGGFMERFFKLIFWLIEYILRGGSFTPPTDPGQPAPTPCLNPSAKPTEPVAQPTISVFVSPTISASPSANLTCSYGATGASATQLFPVTGATPNDSTDDYSVIQTAITNAGNAGGGIVTLPAGTFISNGHIALKNNVKLQGAGPNTIIKAGPNFLATKGPNGGYPVITTAGASNVTITNLTADQSGDTLNGNVAGRLSEYLVHISGSQNVVIDNVYTKNPFTYSIAASSATKFCIKNSNTNAATNDRYDQLDGIHVLDSASGDVINNTVDQRIGTDGDDGLVAHTLGEPVHDVTYANNKVRGGRHGAGMQLALSCCEIYNIKIINNEFWGSPQGIHTGFYEGSGTVRDVTVDTNTFRDNDGDAITFTGASHTNIKVTNNTACNSGIFTVVPGAGNIVENNTTTCQ